MDASHSAQPQPRPDASIDEPYRFGRRPTVRAPYPFSERQFARLLILRSRLRDTQSEEDLLAA